MLAAFGELKDSDQVRFEIRLRGLGIHGGFTLPQEANGLFAGIGLLYRSLDKAKKIGRFFKINPRIPAKLTDDDIDDIDFLYELTQGGEVSQSSTDWHYYPASKP